MTGPAWPACPACGAEDTTILHEANPQARATHATLKCNDCERVFKALVEVAKEVPVPTIVSEGAESRRTTMPIQAGERVEVDDELLGEDHRLLVTAIETRDGRRVRTAPPDDIGTLWCKVFDTVTVKIAVNRGNFTTPGETEVSPETEFFVGDELKVRGHPVVIHAIRTAEGMRYRGSAEAREVVRLYGRVRDDPLEAIRREEEKDRQKAHWERMARRARRRHEEEQGDGAGP